MSAPTDLHALLERGDKVELQRALRGTLEALHAIDIVHPIETWRVRVFRVIALLPVATAAWVLSILAGPERNWFNAFAFAFNAGIAVHMIMSTERRWHRWCLTRSTVREAALQLNSALQQQENTDGNRPRQV
jgi:hypothetical protein